MIKVIGKFVQCPCCKSVLRYEDEDIRKIEDTDYDGYPVTVGHIECPACLKLVEVYQE